jgi:mannosylglycerate hydrolase MGH1-like protein
MKALMLPGAEAEAKDHYTQVAAQALQITTPDPAVNQQLAWAQAALEQAWVCNPTLGCGLVAGYGPSRPGRRPQYDWFFAGDALIATEALLNTANDQRASDALAFIAKYQDTATGMIWHEISQSADPAEWATRYPYMFVHVDITFQYLIAVDDYVTATGDTRFLQEHWSGIAAAYRYCASLLNTTDGLPRIPATKEGGNEQDKITDDLDLSISWVNASSAFSHLAHLAGHPEQAEQASHASEQARKAAATHYWDDTRGTWIDGYNEAGRPIMRGGDDGINLVIHHLLDPQRSSAVLDHLASAEFQADWGTRGVPTTSPQWNPTSYSKGSVSAAGTAGIAAAYWSQHRPVTAFTIWSALLPWGTLDSMGHMHELLAGDFYHQQAESVPEQTWSSAAFLSSTVRGLLGLQRNAQSTRLEFSPHLPPNWNEIQVAHIKVAGGTIALQLSRVPGGLNLKAENSGKPLDLTFSPQIPLGAHALQAEWNTQSIAVHKEDHPQDTHATLHVSLPTGNSHGLLRYTGGVSVSVSAPEPLVGEASHGIRITSVRWQRTTLSIGAEVPELSLPGASMTLWSNEPPISARGATLTPVSAGVYHLSIPPAALPRERKPNQTVPYRHVEVSVSFADGPSR